MDTNELKSGLFPESDDRFELLYEKLPLGYQSLDENGRFIAINERWLEILGYSREEVVGKWFGDFLAESFVQPFRERFPLFKSLGRIHSEFEMVKKDGNSIFVAFDGRIGYTPEGNFKQTHCILDDITERRRAETELKKAKEESERNEQLKTEILEKFNESQKIGKIGSWDLEIGSGKVWWSDELYRIFEVDPFTYVPSVESNALFVHPDDRESYHKALFDAIGSGQTLDMNIRIITSSGETKHCKSMAKTQTDDLGNPVRMLGSFVDVTGLVQIIKELIATEEKAQESEEKFRRAIFDAPFPIMIHAEDGEVITVNQEWTSLTGYSHKDIPTISVWTEKAYHQKSTIVKDYIDQLYALNHKKEDGEYEIFTADGSAIIWDFSSAPLGKMSDGRRLVISIARDVTHHKKVEEGLKENEGKFRNLFENSPVGKSLTGIDGSMQVNRAFCDLVGYSQEELQTRKWIDISFPEDVPFTNEYVRSLLEGTISVARFEKRYIHKCGDVVWADVSTYLQRDKDGRPLFYITSVLDITERKQTEVLLKESEEKYRSLVELSSDAIFINQSNQITYLNRSAMVLFGASEPEQIIGRSPFDMFHPDYHEAIGRRITDMLSRGIAVQSFEEKIIRLDGTVVDVEVAATPFTFKGEPAIQVVLRDISDRKRIEAEIKLFSEELEQKVLLRTKELNETISELEEQTRVFVGRELVMIELKERIAELERSQRNGISN
jgi:PAS domain S-box-containing protein